MTVNLFTSPDFWRGISPRVRAASQVQAAIAYVGRNAGRYLPLKRGDQLVVDMSLASVRAGTTDPFEIEKFQKRGVEVFSRPGLHAKLIVLDRAVIVGSGNASSHSARSLDEAAVYAEDAAVYRAAVAFVRGLAVEPVRREYLAQCKKAYRPPHFKKPAGKSSSVRHARCWFVSLSDYDVPEAEQDRYNSSVGKAQSRARHPEATDLGCFHWPSRPRMADDLQAGTWLLMSVRDADGAVEVWPPAQFLWMDHYKRPGGNVRYLFHYETPKQGRAVSWSAFLKRLPRDLRFQLKTRRTRAIRDGASVDSLLRLWSITGRFRR